MEENDKQVTDQEEKKQTDQENVQDEKSTELQEEETSSAAEAIVEEKEKSDEAEENLNVMTTATPAEDTDSDSSSVDEKNNEGDADSSGDIKSENDAGDDDNHDEEQHEEEQLPDFDKFSKAELADYLVELKTESDMRRLDRILKEIRPHFDEIYNKEREEALKNYLESTEDAEESDFEYKGDESDQRFNDYYDMLKSRRNEYFSQREKVKDDNLKTKHRILDEIRQLVDGEETNVSIHTVKKLQEEWKNVGPVPTSQNRTLWANYNALLDRFYDARSIYFELKELDRKKNLKAKLNIVERAEELDKLENIKDAITQLNDLHEEFKHIGPVPKEEQEPLWLRFKAASDQVYAKRKEYTEHLKKELYENLEKKDQLGDDVQSFTEFDSDRINDWNDKTKEILELQKKWEAIGGLPRDKAKQTNKKFWGGFKQFFNNKNAFFKRLESMREENLEKKKQLVEKAEAIKESTEWDKTSEELKKLQKQWKDIGPVPEKQRNEIYKQFKSACDYFFDQRRAQNKEQNKEFEDNFKKKIDICNQMEKMSKEDQLDLDAIYDLVDEYSETGFVPRNQIKATHNRFDEVCKKLMEHKSLSDEDKDDLRTNIQVNKLKGSPHGGRKLQRKENALRRKINSLESDITTWKTNLEFFASSKKADALKDDFQDKIDKATEELQDLKRQLKILHQA